MLCTILAVPVGLALGFVPAPVEAHHCKGPHSEDPGCEGGGAGGGGGGGSISVAVGLRDDDDPDNPDRLLSDELGAYFDKVDQVGASIGNTGDFAMKLTKGNQPPIRKFFLDFKDCASGDCISPSLIKFTEGGANVFATGTDMKAMKIGESFPLKLRIGIDLTGVGGDLWILFLEGEENADCPDSSSTTTVSKISDNTWTITAGENAHACLSRRDGGGQSTPSGNYLMPFLMKVVKM